MPFSNTFHISPLQGFGQTIVGWLRHMMSLCGLRRPEDEQNDPEAVSSRGWDDTGASIGTFQERDPEAGSQESGPNLISPGLTLEDRHSTAIQIGRVSDPWKGSLWRPSLLYRVRSCHAPRFYSQIY